jgi:IclR family acetate operon transcriptional repressor
MATYVARQGPEPPAIEATLKAGVPELRRAASRLSELLDGSVY